MLVLSRRKDESVMIGDNLQVRVLDIQKNHVKLGIEAPKEISVHRMEVYEAIQQENLAATQVAHDNLAALTDILKASPIEPNPKAGVKIKGKKPGPKA